MRSTAIFQVRDCQPQCQLSRCKAKPLVLLPTFQETILLEQRWNSWRLA
jgi:hypothetical protein